MEAIGCLSPLAEGRTVGYTMLFFCGIPLFSVGTRASISFIVFLTMFFASLALYSGFHRQTMWMTLLLYSVVGTSSVFYCHQRRAKAQKAFAQLKTNRFASSKVFSVLRTLIPPNVLKRIGEFERDRALEKDLALAVDLHNIPPPAGNVHSLNHYNILLKSL